MSVKTDLEKLNTLPETIRGDLSTRIKEEKELIIQSLIDLAKGTYREETGLNPKTGTTYKYRIYQTLPDKEVAQYLLNQIIGKPKENAAVQGRVNFILDE